MTIACKALLSLTLTYVYSMGSRPTSATQEVWPSDRHGPDRQQPAWSEPLQLGAQEVCKLNQTIELVVEIVKYGISYLSTYAYLKFVVIHLPAQLILFLPLLNLVVYVVVVGDCYPLRTIVQQFNFHALLLFQSSQCLHLIKVRGQRASQRLLPAYLSQRT